MTSILLRMKYEQFGIWITFLRHHIHELQTVRNGQIFSWLKLIGIFGAVWFLQTYAKNIFKYGDTPNISFTHDKELNILIYRSPSYLIIYRSHTLFIIVRFLAHPV